MKFLNDGEPLGLPKGSVRAIIVLLPLLSVVVATHRQLLVPTDMWDLLKTAFAFYFFMKLSQNGNGK